MPLIDDAVAEDPPLKGAALLWSWGACPESANMPLPVRKPIGSDDANCGRTNGRREAAFDGNDPVR